jgi:hypothetical protein
MGFYFNRQAGLHVMTIYRARARRFQAAPAGADGWEEVHQVFHRDQGNFSTAFPQPPRNAGVAIGIVRGATRRVERAQALRPRRRPSGSTISCNHWGKI